MSAQKDVQADGTRASSDDAVALAELLADSPATIAFAQRVRRRSRPLPRLDWPADLFCDGLTT